MNNKDIHWDKYQQELPGPLTSADEAWKNMSEILDTEMPVSGKNSKKRVFSLSLSQLLISVVAAMAFLGGGAYYVYKYTENTKEINTGKDPVKHQDFNSIVTDTVHVEDTVATEKTLTHTFVTIDKKTNTDSLQQPQKKLHQTFILVPVNKKNNAKETLSKEQATKTSQSAGTIHPQSNNLTKTNDSIELNQKINDADSNSIYQNSCTSNILLSKNEDPSEAALNNKVFLIDSLKADKNSPIGKVLTKEKKKEGNAAQNYQKNNYLFIGLSGNNGLLFSKNASKNIYLYGEILTIGIHNNKYNMSVETGIGFQSLEYRVPYSRTLYTYQATVVYDSTITISSYKYSRYSIVIPIFITKEIFNYKHIYFEVKTGIYTSVFLSKQRLFNQLPADIELMENSYLISDINLSFALAPQLRWDINDKLSLNLNAGGIIYLNSLYQNHSLKPIGVNLSAGIHYIL